MEIDRDFFVDFHDRPGGPARAHEVRLQNGDCHNGDLPVIVAHHLGEHLIPQLVAGGAVTGPALIIVMRARLSRLGRSLRRRLR